MHGDDDEKLMGFCFVLQFVWSQSKNRLNTFMAGLGAGVTEAFLVVTPAETLKVKLIHDKLLDTPKYKGMIDGIRTIAA